MSLEDFIPMLLVIGAILLAPRRLRSRRSDLANQLLFVRSHWVRMPPGMLLRHLLHKLLKPRKPPLPTEELPG